MRLLHVPNKPCSRHAFCYNANGLQYRGQLFNRRTRGRLHRATAVLSLAVWLLIGGAELCPPFHAWLHGGTIPDDDDCAVVAIALGHVDSAPCDVPPVIPIQWIEITPRPEISIFTPVAKTLPCDRGPPFGGAVS